ncbi:MAG: hypothetical protein HKN76_05145 [Saprospiraceae bacterium]|nr:hypothetical protein [Saprospiraceae bacterium]
MGYSNGWSLLPKEREGFINPQKTKLLTPGYLYYFDLIPYENAARIILNETALETYFSNANDLTLVQTHTILDR